MLALTYWSLTACGDGQWAFVTISCQLSKGAFASPRPRRDQNFSSVHLAMTRNLESPETGEYHQHDAPSQPLGAAQPLTLDFDQIEEYADAARSGASAALGSWYSASRVRDVRYRP